MNIAISSLIVLILILPGIVVRKFYYSEEFSSQYTSKNFFELLFFSFIPSMIVHTLAIGIVNFSGNSIDFKIIGQLLSSKGSPKEAYENIETQEGTLIYDCFLVDYELSNKSDLKYITLKNVQRRYLLNDSENQEVSNQDAYYKIPGHILVIPNDKIINFNFLYYKFIDVEGGIGFELIS